MISIKIILVYHVDKLSTSIQNYNRPTADKLSITDCMLWISILKFRDFLATLHETAVKEQKVAISQAIIKQNFS